MLNILDQLNLLVPREDQTKLRLLFNRKSTQIAQLVLFHKKLIKNMMVFNNSRSHSTLKTPPTRMISKMSITHTRHQIQVLTTKRKLLKSQLYQLLQSLLPLQNQLQLLLINLRLQELTFQSNFLPTNLLSFQPQSLSLPQKLMPLKKLQPLQLLLQLQLLQLSLLRRKKFRYQATIERKKLLKPTQLLPTKSSIILQTNNRTQSLIMHLQLLKFQLLLFRKKRFQFLQMTERKKLLEFKLNSHLKYMLQDI